MQVLVACDLPAVSVVDSACEAYINCALCEVDHVHVPVKTISVAC